MRILDDIQYSEGMTVICTDVSLLISQLEFGKSAGPGSVCAVAIKIVRCSLLYVSHGYLPLL